jgi:hypothetical protein
MDGLDLGQEMPAGRRERHAAAGSVDEGLAELVLELAKALAHAGLGDPQLLSGTPEMELLSKGEEDPDLP